MKRFYIILSMIMMALPFLQSCNGDDSDENSSGSSLKVVSSAIVFEPTGGAGKVTVQSNGSVTATSAQPWCTVSVSGNVVSVTAAPYGGLESRYSVITISADGESMDVVAQQFGVILKFADRDTSFMIDDAADTAVMVASSNYPVTVSASKEWITGSFSNDSLRIVIAENKSGHMRTGYYRYTIGNVTDSIKVTQCETKDILGDYTLSPAGSTETVASEGMTLSKGSGDNDVVMTFASTLWKLDATFDPKTHVLTIPNRQYIGDCYYGTTKYYTFMCLFSSISSYFSTATTTSAAVAFAWDDASSSTVGSFFDNGTWKTYKANALIFVAYSKYDTTTNTFSGTRKIPSIIAEPKLTSK